MCGILKAAYKHPESGVRILIKKFMVLAFLKITDIEDAKNSIIAESADTITAYPILDVFY